MNRMFPDYPRLDSLGSRLLRRRFVGRTFISKDSFGSYQGIKEAGIGR